MDSASVFGSAIGAIRLMDDIVSRHPECIEARVLRIFQSLRLPEPFFHRTRTAITDLETLLDRAEQEHGLLPEDLITKLRYLLGKAYLRMGLKPDAEAAWKGLLAGADQEPRYRDLVEKALGTGTEEEGKEAAEATGNEKDLFKRARQLHDLAMESSGQGTGQMTDPAAKQAVSQALKILEQLYEKHPDVPIIEGYYGSSLALAGRESEDAQGLFGSAIKGMKHLNHAVEKSPDNARLRLLRASMCVCLPEAFFHVGEKGYQDFLLVLSAYEKDRSLLTPEQYGRVLHDMARCCERLGKGNEAEGYWSRLAQADPQPKYLGRK